MHVKLSHKTQTLIVEAVDLRSLCEEDMWYAVCGEEDMPNHGIMLFTWIEIPMPRVIYTGEDSMRIIHSIVPYEPRKRRRDAVRDRGVYQSAFVVSLSGT